MKRREDLWRETLRRAWWAVCEHSAEWEGEQTGFSSCSDPARGLQDDLESWVCNPCSWRLEHWCLTLAGKYRGITLVAELKTRVAAVPGHGCMSPGGPMWIWPLSERWKGHQTWIVSCLKLMSKENNDLGWCQILTANVRWIFEWVNVAPKVTCLFCRMPGSCDLAIPLILKE